MLINEFTNVCGANCGDYVISSAPYFANMELFAYMNTYFVSAAVLAK